MKPRDHRRPAVTLLATLAVVVGLAACESSDAGGDSTPVTSETTEVPTSAATGTVITEADVADLEQQLDEIDQLIAGVDADLAQD